MVKTPKQLRYVLFKIEDIEGEHDYSDCYYEGEIPRTVMTGITLKQLSLEELLDSLSKTDLKKLGLERLP